MKFGALLYTKAWIEAPLSAYAHVIDLLFWKNIKKYEFIHAEISQAVKDVLQRNLWYLSVELERLALFSEKVSPAETCDIVNAMRNNPQELRRVRRNAGLLKTSK